jgi:hypothetical protein
MTIEHLESICKIQEDIIFRYKTLAEKYEATLKKIAVEMEDYCGCGITTIDSGPSPAEVAKAALEQNHA